MSGDLTEAFWVAARNGVLVRPVCGDCDRNFFSPQIACPRCLSENWSYEPSSGRGTVYSVTVVHKAPSPEFEVPYVLAVVELDEGWSMLANLVDEAPIGAPVELTWVDRGERRLPAFRAVRS